MRDAVAAARRGAPAWAATPWQERVAILERAADQISEHRDELAALMAMEVGKNRLEALGDVEESADLIRYYCHQMTEHDGFELPMGRLNPVEETSDVMRPYGVWAVISPFNFPMALSAGPIGAALVAGNTVVLKPSEQGVFTGLMTCQALWVAGRPGGRAARRDRAGRDRRPRARHRSRRRRHHVHRLVRGRHGDLPHLHPGAPEADDLRDGRQEPGRSSAATPTSTSPRRARRAPRSGSAGRSARPRRASYVERRSPRTSSRSWSSRRRASSSATRSPATPTWARSSTTPRSRASSARSTRRRELGTVHCGGERITDGALARGTYLPPTVVEVPRDSWIWSTELFVPLIAVDAVDSLDEAFTLANDTPLGLTAGLFSREPDRGRCIPRTDRGRRRLRQPARRRDDRRVARRAAVRRLEGVGHQRQGGRRPVLRAAVPPRAEPNGGGVHDGHVGDEPRRTRKRRCSSPTSPGRRPRRGSSATSASRARRWAACTHSCRSRASGLVIEDVDGNRFLDFNAGIAVTSTGHCHPAVVEAISNQAGQLIHYCSSDFYPPVYAELSERLVAKVPIAGDEQGVPHQLGHRGRRGVDQARPPLDRAAVRDRVPRRVPRPQPRQPGAHREQGEVPPGLRPAAARRAPRALRRRRLHRRRPVQAPRDARRGRGRHRRADPGRGRLHRPARRLARAAAGAVRPARDPASSPTRSRAASAAPASSGRVEHEGIEPDILLSGKGLASGHAARRAHRPVGPHEVERRRARLDVRRQPGCVRGRDRDARPRRGLAHRQRGDGRRPALHPAARSCRRSSRCSPTSAAAA